MNLHNADCNRCSKGFCIVLLKICKAFPEEDVIWMGAHVALIPVYTPFSIDGAPSDVQFTSTTTTMHMDTIIDEGL